MPPTADDDLEPGLDALAADLRRHRPEPSDEQVLRIEARVLGRPRRTRPRRRTRDLAFGAVLAAVLAGTASVLALTGLNPLGGNAGDVEAGSRCRTVTITVLDRPPLIRTDERGVLRVERERARPVERAVRRCR